jgi:predicted cupin superfamily sugar epimerase
MEMKPIELAEHPEGGRFEEVYRSASRVCNENGDRRCALTHIYFSLAANEVSHFHRVGSDEVWNLYRGMGIRLYMWDGRATSVDQVVLSASGNEYCHVVPAGTWQAAVPIKGQVLVGCSVAPGFEFADFEMMLQGSDAAELISSEMPELKGLVSTCQPKNPS